jgi:hypothetical protein
MLTMQDLREHYRVTDQDAELLLSLKPLAEENRERFSLEYDSTAMPLTRRVLNRLANETSCFFRFGKLSKSSG